MEWFLFRHDALDDLGYIPGFIIEADPRPAKEQLHENYAHGGGWRDFGTNQWELDRQHGYKLKFPGDPPLKPSAMARLRDEIILVYPHGMVMILQRDGSFEVAKLD